MTEDQGADSVKQRLMDQINDQAVSADKAEGGDVIAENAVAAALLDEPPEKVPEDEQKQPRDQREIIGGEEIPRRKSQKGEVLAGVQTVGKRKSGQGI